MAWLNAVIADLRGRRENEAHVAEVLRFCQICGQPEEVLEFERDLHGDN